MIGVDLILLPVAKKIAFATAGGIGGPPGSPMPPHHPSSERAK